MRPPAASGHRGAWVEGALLLLVLAGLQAGQLFLGSTRAVRAFISAAPVADLLHPEKRTLHLAADSDPARLGGFDPLPDRRYLLVVGAEAGRPFAIQMIDREAKRALRNWRLPARATAGEHVLPIESWALGAPNRFEIRNPAPADLTITAFEIRELHPAHGWLQRSVRPLALVALALFGFRHRRALASYLGSGDGGAVATGPSAVDALVAGVVLVVCFHVFDGSPVHQVLDAKYSTVVSHRLLTQGKLSLPANFSDATPDSVEYQLQWIGEDLYHFFPEAVAVLNTPFVALFKAFGITPVSAEGVFLRHQELRILTFAASFQAALLCALLFFLARLYLRPTPALALTAVFAFGTQIYSSVSRPYWSHAWALVLLAAGVYLLLAPRWRDRRWAVATAATCLAWSFLCRPPMGLSIAGLTVYLLIEHRRHRTLFIAAGAAWGAAYFAYSLDTFGQVLPPYYLFNLETAPESSPLRARYLDALHRTLFSPSRGLLVYVPFLAAIPVVALRYLSRLCDRTLAVIALIVCLLHWQVVAVNRTWYGGQSFGPRLFADLLIWFFLLAAMALPVWWHRALRGRRVTLVAQVTLVAVLIAAAVFVNTRGANSQATYNWNGHYSDWSDPQFLTGLRPPPQPLTLGERLARLRETATAAERDAVLGAVMSDDAVKRRWIETDRTLAAFVTWDGWTYGESPAALVAINDGDENLTSALRLSSWADAGIYPITVHVEDGDRTTAHRLTGRGAVEIRLAPVPPRSRRLYVVWSDKTWTPGPRDPRSLGVQLLAPE